MIGFTHNTMLSMSAAAVAVVVKVAAVDTFNQIILCFIFKGILVYKFDEMLLQLVLGQQMCNSKLTVWIKVKGGKVN